MVGEDEAMQAVILAGGRGERLKPLTDAVPKPLVPVAGRPFLDFLVLYLKKRGIADIILLTGYLADMIERHVGDGSRFGMMIRCSREETPLGTGGALKNALPLLRDEFFLMNGDTLLPVDYRVLAAALAPTPFAALLSAYPASAALRPANLKLGEGGRVLGYGQGASAEGFTHADAGAGLFRKSIAKHFPAGEAFSLEKNVDPRLIERGLLGAYPAPEDFYDIGTPAGIKRFEEFVRGKGREIFRE